MNKVKSKEIVSLLREIIPNPVCELDYRNPFELIIAVSLSAQTTDKRVNMVTPALFEKYPDPYTLSQAEYGDVLPMIQSLGLAKNKARNIIALSDKLHKEFHDTVPSTMEELETLPGVGRKTASVVLAVGYKIPAMPVDTHLHRMAIRLGYIKDGDDVLAAEAAYRKYIPEEDWIDAHHLFLLFGRYHCTAKNPQCQDCKLKSFCKYKG